MVKKAIVRHTVLFINYSLADLLAESYGRGESNLYYFVAVVKKGSGINSVYDLAGKTTCNTGSSKYLTNVFTWVCISLRTFVIL